MAQHVREIMTQDPVTPAERTPLTEVARLMPERETGDAIIVEADDVRGPVTDVSPGNGGRALEQLPHDIRALLPQPAA